MEQKWHQTVEEEPLDNQELKIHTETELHIELISTSILGRHLYQGIEETHMEHRS